MKNSKFFWFSMIANILLGIIVLFAILDPLYFLNLNLKLNKVINISLDQEIPVKTAINQDLTIAVKDKIQGRVTLDDNIDIQMTEVFEIPLDFELDVTINSFFDFTANTGIDIDVPVNIPLTKEQLNIKQLKVDLSDGVYIDELVEVDMVLPIDTTVKTLAGLSIPIKADIPVQTVIPIKQKMHIAESVNAKIDDLEANLVTAIPFKADIPLKGKINVSGATKVPVRRMLEVPVSKSMNLPITSTIPVTIDLREGIPVSLDFDLESKVSLKETVPVMLEGEFSINSDDVNIGIQKHKPQKNQN